MNSIARGAALFVGVFLVVALADGDLAHWLVDLRGVAATPRAVGFAAVAAVLVIFGLSGRLARSAATALGILACLAAFDAAQVARLPGVETGPVSASALLATALGVAAVASCGPARGGIGVVVPAAGACAALFALTQIACFGPSDYRRPADAIVVFGARAYANGRPSRVLRDRVDTACDLYLAGLAPRLILSGGPGDGDVHETDAMQALALAAGVPAEAIVRDRGGVSTRATVENVAQLLAPGDRILAVSHGYHLPRVHIAFERAGVRAFAVPAAETRRVWKKPLFVAREVAAFWAYLARPSPSAPR